MVSLRLKDRLKEYHGDDFLKAEASQKVQKFMEWALACISFHYRRSSTRSAPVSWVGSRLAPSGAGEVQLRLSAFKFFLDLAGDSLSGKDFTEAFDAACFPLTLFSSLFDPGWSSGAPAAMIQGLLGLLVEWGADNVNQCFLEAARFGSTELVRILLQVNFTFGGFLRQSILYYYLRRKRLKNNIRCASIKPEKLHTMPTIGGQSTFFFSTHSLLCF